MLLLRFSVHLEKDEIDDLVRPKGALFHRWLPDGKKSAINLPVKDSKNSIKIWFNRRGYVDKLGFVRFDREKKKVDPNVMKLQGCLDAGQLWGEARFAHVTASEMEAIRDERIESNEYILVAKRVIQFLYPPLRNFINLIRCQYGQYWLKELNEWDSRKESLGSYCSTTLWLSWSDKSEKSWKRFIPTKISGTIKVQPLPGRGFAEYLTRNDWDRIKKSFNPYKDIPIALTILGRAHELSDTGHIREAFIQGVTALELAIEKYTKTTLEINDKAENLLSSFYSMPLKAKVLILAKPGKLLSAEILEKSIAAIDMRNSIVHEGKYPDDNDKKNLYALLDCAAKFIDLEELKKPVLYPGNQLSSAVSKGAQLAKIG